MFERLTMPTKFSSPSTTGREDMLFFCMISMAPAMDSSGFTQ